ncbi:probable cytochrome P450 6a14 isoform X2 [Tribolium madens]|uniref:probable cytochrome P450 6a14 isoform X2 n=1 Tax=Tribolium madens TaxID=41895 RepID=UPI001CF733C5|nr:probable cytochrome P450 6a14 isoform X2 [Tribolium madens]
MLGHQTFGEQFLEFYNKIKTNGFKHGGVYFCLQQFYVPVDPEIIKHIMQKDFHHFMNHGNYFDSENDPLSGHLFNLEDAKWKNMRVNLTPTFTSGKIKMMFQTLADCASGLKPIVDKAAKNHTSIDIKDILARFTTDVIGSVAFGLECNSLKHPEAEFRKFGKRIFEIDVIDRIKILLQLIFPRNILQAMKMKTTKPEVEEFFMKAIRDTVNYREKNNIYRKDFMHLLIQLKNRGVVTDDGNITSDQRFETSSTTMTFALYEIASNPQIQEKLREEIITTLAKYNGELSYNAIMELGYMEKVIHETLRKYPPLPLLIRQCTKDYTIPNTTIRLKKGDMVGIAAQALHYDPEYHPDPEKFDPERFSEENKNKRPDFTWIPFGEGPRVCIGLRFGMIQSKVGLTTLLRNYKITLNKKTKVPLEMDKKAFVSSPEGGVWLDVQTLE